VGKGRKGKPIERQIAEGDPQKRGVHKLDEKLASAPTGEKGLPSCPEYLQIYAREAYEFWKIQLELMEADYTALALTLEGGAVQWHQFREAYETLNREGRTVLNEKAREVNHPAVARLNQSWANLKAFLEGNGLTLVSRGRIDIPRPDRGEQDLAKILSAPREKKTPAVQ
jgi:P27 family predicted phage terminase small subunit